MGFSDSVLTKGKGGKTEVRALDSRWMYVLCKYLDSDTLKEVDRKRKLCLRDVEGNIQEFFIIPLKSASRSLLVAAEREEKEMKVWNEKTRSEEDLWVEGS